MKNILYSLSLIFILASCGAMNKVGNVSDNQIVVERTDDEILITETFNRRQELALADGNPEDVPASSQNLTDSKRLSLIDAEKEIKVVVKDTIYLDVNPQEEAIYSEELSKKAVVWSFTPLLALLAPFTLGIFLLWIPVGIVITLVLINKHKKLTYVTEKSLRQRKNASIALGLISALVVILLLLAIFIILSFLIIL